MGTVVERLVLWTRGKIVTYSTVLCLGVSPYSLVSQPTWELALLLAGRNQEEKQSRMVQQLANESHLTSEATTRETSDSSLSKSKQNVSSLEILL